MDKNWTTWNTQAMQALDRGDIEQAERAFRQACGSGDPRADSNLGWFYFLMGGSVRDSEAEARYWIQKALQRSRHPRILQNIARLRFENGDFAGALAALQEAHRADQSPVLLYNLGMCHFWLGDKAAAAVCFREADAANAADLLRAQCGAVHPRLAYAFCVQGEERAAALRRYALERNDMELWDYVLLCVQCEAYAMAAPVLPELVSQWALTDQTLAMTALCLQHVPAEKERVLRCFSDELSEERDRLLHLLGLLFAVHALRPFLKASGGLGNAFGERLLRLLALIFLVLLAFHGFHSARPAAP